MKRALAIALAIAMLSLMSISALAYSTPAEAANAFEVGVWGQLTPGVDCDPALDGQGIKDGVHVYGLFDAAYAPIEPPSSIAGYTQAASAGEMTDGTYFVLAASSGFNYLLVMGEPAGGADGQPVPEPEPEVVPEPEPEAQPDISPISEPVSGGPYVPPPEVADVMETGVWPMAAGMYDPLLDGQGIKDGTRIYGFYDFDMTTFAVTPYENVPTSITGYTAAATPADMTAGTFCILTVNSGVEYSYVLILSDAPAEPAAPAPATGTAETPAASAPAASAPAAPVGSIPAFSGVVDGAAYITVSVNGTLHAAAYPIPVGEGATVQSFLIAAHDELFPGGAAAGYADGIDPTYQMFMINTCWGVLATPFVIMNDQPLQTTADITPIYAGDNIVISTSSDMMVPALAIAMTVEFDGNNAIVTAKNWVLDFMTFTYSNTPYANAPVINPATGESLGTTGADGKITVPAVGAAAIEGLSAVPVDAAMSGIEKTVEELPLIEASTWAFLLRLAIIVIPVFIAVFINMINRRKEYKHLDPLYKAVPKNKQNINQNQTF